VIAKCGEVRVWHWAHWRAHGCDRWSEPETKWHRDWKNHFPENWQEISHTSENGEKHRADVKTESAVVLEFQHSHLDRNEREARETFYQKMVWVVNGLRRKQDRPRFFGALNRPRFFEALRRASSSSRPKATILKPKPLTYALRSNEHPLLRDWVDSSKPVFFHFGDNSEPGDPPFIFGGPVLWRLEPRSGLWALLSPITKTSFLDRCLKRSPLKAIDYSSEVCPRPLELIDFEDAWLSGRE
jgi:hypothetical protein